MDDISQRILRKIGIPDFFEKNRFFEHGGF